MPVPVRTSVLGHPYRNLLETFLAILSRSRDVTMLRVNFQPSPLVIAGRPIHIVRLTGTEGKELRDLPILA